MPVHNANGAHYENGAQECIESLSKSIETLFQINALWHFDGHPKAIAFPVVSLTGTF